MARKYLGIPPTSAFSERVFSSSENIANEKRTWLGEEKLEMLVFLNKNSSFIWVY